jgi:hypothetical protein
VNTRWGWALAVSPVGVAVLILLPIVAGGSLSALGVWLAFATCSVVGIFLARMDRRHVQRLGVRPVPAFWAIVPGVYLFVSGSRTFDEVSGGLRPAWTHLLLCGIFLLIVLVGALCWPAFMQFAELKGEFAQLSH